MEVGGCTDTMEGNGKCSEDKEDTFSRMGLVAGSRQEQTLMQLTFLLYHNDKGVQMEKESLQNVEKRPGCLGGI